MLVTGFRRLACVAASLLLLTAGIVLFHAKIKLSLITNGIQYPLYGDSESATEKIAETHHELYSASTPDRKYFRIDFGDEDGFNPSIIPHPHLDDTWIITAQRRRNSSSKSVWFAELVCNAVFEKASLRCTKPPAILPISATAGDNCVGDLEYFSWNVGPHDARVFYGPDNPYTIYGSNSGYTCFGQWIQDFRMLVDWEGPVFPDNFKLPTEIQRPEGYGPIEKNWFLFWDEQGQAYVHYDVVPKRSFARLRSFGAVGQDLAPLASPNDERCMAAYMPQIAPQLESVHQASNSLSITLCDRSDSSCESNETNTFILTIFQHKSFYSFHSVYEPYVMLFRQSPPFEIHGISSKPLWIHGRGQIEKKESLEFEESGQTEMFYVTSISWKAAGQRYHGYLDDVLFFGFGIEDERAGGIDVVAADLIRGISLCSAL